MNVAFMDVTLTVFQVVTAARLSVLDRNVESRFDTLAGNELGIVVRLLAPQNAPLRLVTPVTPHAVTPVMRVAFAGLYAPPFPNCWSDPVRVMVYVPSAS
jgi:hypothetical protein